MPLYLPASSGGGSGGPETDPVAIPALTRHETEADPHADRAYTDTAVASARAASLALALILGS